MPLTSTAAQVNNGLFTVSLDIGSAVFDGNARWLAIEVRTNGGGAFVPLTPRQALNPAPNAIYAAKAGLAASATTASTVAVGSVGTAGLATGAVDSSRIADGSIGIADLGSEVVSNTFWQLGGNAGTTAGTHFLGTTDNRPFEIRAKGQSAWRIEPTSTGPNLIGGRSLNVIGTGSSDCVIGGGYNNAMLTNCYSAVIAGGAANRMEGGVDFSFVGAGANAWILEGADYATIPGGRENRAGSYSFAAGYRASARHTGSFVWADFLTPDFATTKTNQFLVRAAGGVGINTNNPQAALHVAGTVKADAFVALGTTPASFPSVGIGTSSPQDAVLDVEGNMHLNDFDLFLRAGTDRNHGLGWFGSGKAFDTLNLDGPVLYGCGGGGLGSACDSQHLALRWLGDGTVVLDPRDQNGCNWKWVRRGEKVAE